MTTHINVFPQAKPKHSTTRRPKPLKRQLVDANGRALPGVQMKAGSAFNLEGDETHGAPARWPQVNKALHVVSWDQLDSWCAQQTYKHLVCDAAAECSGQIKRRREDHWQHDKAASEARETRVLTRKLQLRQVIAIGTASNERVQFVFQYDVIF